MTVGSPTLSSAAAEAFREPVIHGGSARLTRALGRHPQRPAGFVPRGGSRPHALPRGCEVDRQRECR